MIDLWENFMATGKPADYLKYRRRAAADAKPAKAFDEHMRGR